MNHQIFSVYDAKAQAYITPFFLPTVGMAVRAMADCLADPNHSFSRHPEDYTLFHLGTFEDMDGILEAKERTVVHSLVEIRAAAVQQLDFSLNTGDTPAS